ncbi:hypothetical protein BRC63_00495 [Halobacteriales archaeon QH_10_70_21]|nr:MAG: hypothetical protein BRC63_00495 [Halobacteriales archaeon QH_10_70_21]
MVYITHGLLTALLDLGADRDPSAVTVSLAVTNAGELDVELPPETSVFTDMYLPEAGESVTAVFGMDLSTPEAAGRFVTHPEGPLALTKRDDLHEVVFVAVPPYDDDCVGAFDRSGDRVPIDVLDVAPPHGSLEDYSR